MNMYQGSKDSRGRLGELRPQKVQSLDKHLEQTTPHVHVLRASLLLIQALQAKSTPIDTTASNVSNERSVSSATIWYIHHPCSDAI